jgi:hypothetical protein
MRSLDTGFLLFVVLLNTDVVASLSSSLAASSSSQGEDLLVGIIGLLWGADRICRISAMAYLV